jgi:uncharacterized metal-binding protein YceD (DUF177 family)
VKRVQELKNDTVINVAALLKETVGSVREIAVDIDRFELDEDLIASAIHGDARLIRLQDEILADVNLLAEVGLECDRCLGAYQQPVRVRFSAEFQPTIDVHTGHVVGEAEDELAIEHFYITEHHEVDLAEPMRQELIISLPMVAVCGPECPGPDVTSAGVEGEIDDRLAALERLLGDDDSM